ncbi:MAG: hypothetical protein ACFFE1_14710 [Candidatus Thorarchaeota archaeon]
MDRRILYAIVIVIFIVIFILALDLTGIIDVIPGIGPTRPD